MTAASLLLFLLGATGRPGNPWREIFQGSSLYRDCQAEVRLMELPSLTKAAQPDLIDGSYCVGFVNGFTGNLGSATDAICINGASTGSVVRAYVAFMEKNPKLLQEDRRVGLRLALKQAYACPVSSWPRLANPTDIRPKSL